MILFPEKDFCGRTYIDEVDLCGKSRIDSQDIQAQKRIDETDLITSIEGEGLQAVIYRADTTHVSADNTVLDCSYHK